MREYLRCLATKKKELIMSKKQPRLLFVANKRGLSLGGWLLTVHYAFAALRG